MRIALRWHGYRYGERLKAAKTTKIAPPRARERARNTASARRRRILRSVIRQLTPEAKRISKKMYRATRKTGIKKLRWLIDKALCGRRLNSLSVGVLNSAMRQAEQKWLAAINTAKLRKDAAAYHDVRIKTKTLRYMIESVSRFVEVPGAEATAEWLKTVQDELGEWHDEIELTRRVTAILSEDGTIKPTMLLPPHQIAQRSRAGAY